MYTYLFVLIEPNNPPTPRALIWPLHDIAIANVVWCMAYTTGVRWGVVYCPIAVQWYCNMWAMQAGWKNERTIDSCTND